MVEDRDLANIGHEINNLSVVILQLLCLEKLSEAETDNENKEVNTLSGGQIVTYGKIESFQNKKRFQLKIIGVFLLKDDRNSYQVHL